MRFSTLFFLSSTFLFSDNFSNSLSFQGFTGLINTPNAQVIKEGDAVFSFNNQFDNHLRNYNYNDPLVSQEDYMAGIGFFSMFEVVGRLSEVEAFTEQRRNDVGFELRDMGANVKFQVPYKNEYLPTMAFGLQDPGSESSYYANTYMVLDKEIGFLRTSVGYGKSGDNKAGSRMDGLFGGVEAKVTDWLHLLAEHDGVENHAGIRVNMPQSWTNSFNIGATIAHNLTASQTSVAVNLSIPLFYDSKPDIFLHQVEEHIVATSTPILTMTDGVKNPVLQSESSEKQGDSLLTIQKKLIDIGFENIQVGHYHQSIYVKCENSIFDHTDLDALGVILGIISENSSKDTHYIVTLLKNNLQTLTVSGNSKIFKAYLSTPNNVNKINLRNNLKFSRNFDELNVNFLTAKQNSSFFKPRLELSPGLTTTVATEVGVFDYLVALRANAYTTLYDGLTLSAMYEMPLTHSENFDDGRSYASLYQDKLQNRLVDAQLNQTLHYESLLNTTSVGQFRGDSYGILNHTNFTTTSGEHGFNLRVGSFEDKNDKSLDKRDVYIGSYRYLYAPLDFFTEVSYGKYWNQDTGAMLQLKRFFGETSVALYYKDTEKAYIGFDVSIPLTWRKSNRPEIGQIKGKKDFTYGIRTVVRSAENLLTPSGAIVPTTDLELITHYLDRDRLNASYVKEHLDRMREAYVTYGNI